MYLISGWQFANLRFSLRQIMALLSLNYYRKFSCGSSIQERFLPQENKTLVNKQHFWRSQQSYFEFRWEASKRKCIMINVSFLACLSSATKWINIPFASACSSSPRVALRRRYCIYCGGGCPARRGGLGQRDSMAWPETTARLRL